MFSVKMSEQMTSEHHMLVPFIDFCISCRLLWSGFQPSIRVESNAYRSIKTEWKIATKLYFCLRFIVQDWKALIINYVRLKTTDNCMSFVFVSQLLGTLERQSEGSLWFVAALMVPLWTCTNWNINGTSLNMPSEKLFSYFSVLH